MGRCGAILLTMGLGLILVVLMALAALFDAMAGLCLAAAFAINTVADLAVFPFTVLARWLYAAAVRITDGRRP